MTHGERGDIERLQNDVEREIISLRALIPDPRMLEVFSVMVWRSDSDEEERGWARIALTMAKRIREYRQSHPTHA